MQNNVFVWVQIKSLLIKSKKREWATVDGHVEFKVTGVRIMRQAAWSRTNLV